MSYDLVVKGGLVISPAGSFHADLAISGERIAAIGTGLTGARSVLDAAGLYVIPGAIDGHVHLTDPTFPPFAVPTADSFATGTLAALLVTRAMAGISLARSSIIYGVHPWDPITILSVVVVLMLVALLASYVPARRAASVDPMQALRSE